MVYYLSAASFKVFCLFRVAPTPKETALQMKYDGIHRNEKKDSGFVFIMTSKPGFGMSTKEKQLKLQCHTGVQIQCPLT
jgi:hypothetical protein